MVRERFKVLVNFDAAAGFYLPLPRCHFFLPQFGAASPAEDKVAEAIKAQGISIVHLWAPWCGNCQAELKSGGWTKAVKDNPEVKFYFISVWNSGDDGGAMLTKYEIGSNPT